MVLGNIAYSVFLLLLNFVFFAVAVVFLKQITPHTKTKSNLFCYLVIAFIIVFFLSELFIIATVLLSRIF